MEKLKYEEIIDKIQWSQLQIQVAELPEQVYAETSGRIVLLSRKFVDCVKAGIIPLRFFCFVLMHEFIHIYQQAVLSQKMSKVELDEYICQNRSCLERMADGLALKFILSGLWIKLWTLIISAGKKGNIPLCSYENVVGQWWLIDGVSSNMLNEELAISNSDKSRHIRDLLKGRLDDLKKNDLLNDEEFKLNHELSSALVEIESETFADGIHEKFVRDAIESLKKNGFKKWSDEKLKKSLAHGSHWNDRWNYCNIDFGGKYVYGDNSWGKNAFVYSSHGGRMQFLHSMDCSGGSRYYNLKKIKLWTKFCLDVYKNPKIHDYTIESYVKKEKTFVEEKEKPLFKIMMKEIINDKNNFGAKTIKQFFIENPYPKRDKNRQIIPETLYLDYDVGAVAIGTVAHIIHDCFAQSHTKRCLDPFLFKVFDLLHSDDKKELIKPTKMGYEESSCFKTFDLDKKKKCIYEKKKYDKKGKDGYSGFQKYLEYEAMPVILHANYKNQKSAKHKHADLFLKFLHEDKKKIVLEDVYKLTLNSTMARDCTEMFLYLVETGAGNEEILKFIEQICPYYYRIGPVTSSALQYNKENLDEYYDTIVHSLLGYNYKEILSSRVATYMRVIMLLKQIMEKADDEKKNVCVCSVYEILNEVYAWICVICKEYSLTEKREMALTDSQTKEDAGLLDRFLDWALCYFKKHLDSEFDEGVALCKTGLKIIQEEKSDKAKYCEEQEERKKLQDENESYYIVRITTGNKSGAGTDASVYLSIVGEKGKKIDFTMLDNIGNSFEKNSVEEFEIYSKEDVGNVTGVMVKHDGKHLWSSWYLENIVIEKMSGEKWTCTAKEWVEEDEPRWFPVDGDSNNNPLNVLKASYDKKEYSFVIKVHTGDVLNAATDADVFISIIGKNGLELDFIELTGSGNLFERNQWDEFTIYSECDIGQISAIKVKRNGKWSGDTWFIDEIDVTGNDGKTLFFIADCWLEEKKVITLKPQEAYYDYNVELTMGDCLFAGTDDDVCIGIRGTKGSARCYDVSSRWNNFERNCVDSFVIRSTEDIGEVTSLEIYKDGCWGGNDWGLETVKVSDGKKSRQWLFWAHVWIKKYCELTLMPLCSNYCFEVKIYTGDVSGAGTDANVSISFKGKNYETDPIKIDPPGNSFERNSVETVTIYVNSPLYSLDSGIFTRLPTDRYYELNAGKRDELGKLEKLDEKEKLGELESVFIKRDDSYAGCAWYLKKIEIKDLASQAKWSCNVEEWIKEKGKNCLMKKNGA